MRSASRDNQKDDLRGETWQEYQQRLKKNRTDSKIAAHLPKYGCFLLVLMLAVYGFMGRPAESENTTPLSHANGTHLETDPSSENPSAAAPLLKKHDVRTLLDRNALLNLRAKSIDTATDGHPLSVETSLNLSLQNFMLDKIDRRNARHVGIVAMDPSTGRILSMVSFDSQAPESNQCIDHRFPAASVIKIVTAAAGIEINDYNPDSPFSYNGRKHTLYRSQLKERSNRWTRQITLRDSFAQSVNPVFGKIGADLGKDHLLKYAEALGFNRTIDFEFPVESGKISFSDEPYELAEVASGFNRHTTLSPLHGALIVSTIWNRGQWVAPAIVDRIIDDTGQPIYSGHPSFLGQAITPQTASVLGDLMVATVRSGTGKKIFSGYRRHPILSQLRIGGKSGSINSKAQDKRFDWFVGFAEEKDGTEALVLSVLVAHGKYIGTKAASYARMAMEQYFGNYFAEMRHNHRGVKS
ncbi:MAG: penicillin-binding transpeptidase domain-containing protein [Desulfobacterales bacterium]